MKQMVFRLDSDRTVQVLPDVLTEMDGHPIISYTYSVFKHTENKHQRPSKPNILNTDPLLDPDYLGFITFEEPDRFFSYTASGDESLDSEEVTELIEKLIQIRQDSRLWNPAEGL